MTDNRIMFTDESGKYAYILRNVDCSLSVGYPVTAGFLEIGKLTDEDVEVLSGNFYNRVSATLQSMQAIRGWHVILVDDKPSRPRGQDGGMSMRFVISSPDTEDADAAVI